VAIATGTLAGIGLGPALTGSLGSRSGCLHLLAVWAAKRDAQFVDVVRRHLRYPPHLGV
jgi:type IV secretion system protein VirB3